MGGTFVLRKERLRPGEAENTETFASTVVATGDKGERLLYLNDVKLEPHTESGRQRTFDNRDVLIVVGGAGAICTDAMCEAVQGGDRVTIEAGQRYTIMNDGDIPMHVIQIGLSKPALRGRGAMA